MRLRLPVRSAAGMYTLIVSFFFFFVSFQIIALNGCMARAGIAGSYAIFIFL